MKSTNEPSCPIGVVSMVTPTHNEGVSVVTPTHNEGETEPASMNVNSEKNYMTRPVEQVD